MSAGDNEKLIIAVEKHPAVWDTACSDYKDRIKKVNAWKTICEEVTENYAEIEDDGAKNAIAKQLQTKWRTLRDAFRKNHNAIKNAPSGSGAKKRLYLYAPQMQFLLKTFDAAETTSNIPTPNINNQDELEVQPSPKIERRPKKSKTVDMQILDYLNKPDDSESDDIGLFFRSLKSSVKDFTEDEKLELKSRVISVISDIRKSRNNYLHNNVSGTSGAAAFYTYNVANTNAPQVSPMQTPSVGQLQEMPCPTYAQLQTMQSSCTSPDSNPPSVSSASSGSSLHELLNIY